MRTLKLLFAALAVFTTCGLSVARANNNPLHNPNNAFDVDANGSIQPRDFLLIANQLERTAAGVASPLAATGSTYFWDTNGDTHVSAIDAIGVANHLVIPTPEPSAFVSAGLGLVFLAGYAWRHRRRLKA